MPAFRSLAFLAAASLSRAFTFLFAFGLSVVMFLGFPLTTQAATRVKVDIFGQSIFLEETQAEEVNTKLAETLVMGVSILHKVVKDIYTEAMEEDIKIPLPNKQ